MEFLFSRHRLNVAVSRAQCASDGSTGGALLQRRLGCDCSQHCGVERPTAKHDVSVRYAVCARKYFESVTIEIEPDGAIRRVIHNHRNRAAEGGKRFRDSTGLAFEFRNFPAERQRVPDW
jgi:hypothetical protein